MSIYQALFFGHPHLDVLVSDFSQQARDNLSMKDEEKALLRVTERAYYDDFRERLRAKRVAMNRSQADMARALGIPKSTYEKIEQRDRFPLYLIEKLALFTDMPVEYWVTGRVKFGELYR